MRELADNTLKRLGEHKNVVAQRVRSHNLIPLPGTFMLTGIIGLIICVTYLISGRLDMTWGMTFAIIFAAMLFASIISMTPKND